MRLLWKMSLRSRKSKASSIFESFLGITKISIFFIFFFCTSCGYHMNDESVCCIQKQISIPYIEGDSNGKLTDALIKQLCLSNYFTYSQERGDLILEGKITRETKEYLGYQFDRQPISGKRVNRLVPDEERREITILFSLVEPYSQKVIFGPIEVTACSDYDFFNSDSLQDTSFINQSHHRESVLFFSLGQLDSLQGASQVALDPLYRKLAHKVVEILENLE